MGKNCTQNCLWRVLGLSWHCWWKNAKQFDDVSPRGWVESRNKWSSLPVKALRWGWTGSIEFLDFWREWWIWHLLRSVYGEVEDFLSLRENFEAGTRKPNSNGTKRLNVWSRDRDYVP